MEKIHKTKAILNFFHGLIKIMVKGNDCGKNSSVEINQNKFHGLIKFHGLNKIHGFELVLRLWQKWPIVKNFVRLRIQPQNIHVIPNIFFLKRES